MNVFLVRSGQQLTFFFSSPHISPSHQGLGAGVSDHTLSGVNK